SLSSALKTAIGKSFVLPYGSQSALILNQAYSDGKIIKAMTKNNATGFFPIRFQSILYNWKIFFIFFIDVHLHFNNLSYITISNIRYYSFSFLFSSVIP